MPSSDFLMNLIDLILEYYAQKYENKDYSDEIIIHFLQGNCGLLALTLKAIFPNGEIYVDNNNEHLVFKIDNFYYDARGLINSQNNYHLANQEDFFKLIPYYGTSNFIKTQQIIFDLTNLGLLYKESQDWEKAQSFLKLAK